MNFQEAVTIFPRGVATKNSPTTTQTTAKRKIKVTNPSTITTTPDTRITEKYTKPGTTPRREATNTRTTTKLAITRISTKAKKARRQPNLAKKRATRRDTRPRATTTSSIRMNTTRSTGSTMTSTRAATIANTTTSTLTTSRVKAIIKKEAATNLVKRKTNSVRKDFLIMGRTRRNTKALNRKTVIRLITITAINSIKTEARKEEVNTASKKAENTSTKDSDSIGVAVVFPIFFTFQISNNKVLQLSLTMLHLLHFAHIGSTKVKS